MLSKHLLHALLLFLKFLNFDWIGRLKVSLLAKMLYNILKLVFVFSDFPLKLFYRSLKLINALLLKFTLFMTDGRLRFLGTFTLSLTGLLVVQLSEIAIQIVISKSFQIFLVRS